MSKLIQCTHPGGYCVLSAPCQEFCVLGHSESEERMQTDEKGRPMTYWGGKPYKDNAAEQARSETDVATTPGIGVTPASAVPVMGGMVSTLGARSGVHTDKLRQRPDGTTAAPSAPPGVADVERIFGGTTPAYTISDTTAAPAEALTPSCCYGGPVTELCGTAGICWRLVCPTCSGSGLIEQQDNAAPQVSTASPSAGEGRATGPLPAVAASSSLSVPAEAPTPRTNAQVRMVSQLAPQTQTVPADLCRQLELELSAALERERLANMRADQAEEARDAERELASATQALLEAAQSAIAPLPAWLSDWTPEMMRAVEDYYANWQRIQGIHDPDQVKADSWSALHAWRKALDAALASTTKSIFWKLMYADMLSHARRLELERSFTSSAGKEK